MAQEGRKRSAVKKAASVSLAAVILLLAAFAVYTVICSARGRVVEVFGKCVLTVTTGSMEPSLHVGECIVVEKTDTSVLKEGDIITFYSEQSDIYGRLVTHRITEVLPDGTFSTRGDANPVKDEKNVRPDQILGKYTHKAQFYTWLMSFADMRKLIVLFVMLPMTGMAFYEMKTVIKVGQEIRSESAEERRERLIREAIDKEIERLRAENYVPEEQEESPDDEGAPEDKAAYDDEETPDDEESENSEVKTD